MMWLKVLNYDIGFILDKLKCDREAIAMELFKEEEEDGKQLVSDLTKKQY